MNSQIPLSPSIYVGPDLHKTSIDIAAAEAGRDGEVHHLGTVAGGLMAVTKAPRLERQAWNAGRSCRPRQASGPPLRQA